MGSSLTRRSFLVGAGMLAAPPVLAAPKPAPLDVVIVGAGAAGIAAARRLAAANRRIVVLEAATRVGGRCATDTRTFGVPFDRGAHALYAPDTNPVARLAAGTGLDLYPAPPGQLLRIGRRNAREGEMEDFLAALVRAARAIAEAARGRTDLAAAQALPKDLGALRPTIEFVLGPLTCGRDLAEVSAVDLARAGERESAAFCRQGLGTLIARLANGLPIQLSTPVTRIQWWTRTHVDVVTPKGTFPAQAVIVTASTAALRSGAIQFDPPLPARKTEAIASLPLGSFDRIAVVFDGNPLGLRTDELVFERATDERTAALLANVSGTSLCMIDVAGRFGRRLAAEGEAAMTAFALEWLAKLYGADIRGAVKRVHATQWNRERWVLGAMSAAVPGGHGARRQLAEPLRNRVWFAGEAVHETLWGTVGGAWASGEQAAEAVLAARFGGARTPVGTTTRGTLPPRRSQQQRR
jgi:monoamine oxidase